MTEVFGNAANFYDAVYSAKETIQEVEHFLSLAELGTEKLDSLNILEIGIGTGRHSRIVAERGATVVGIDQSPDMIKRIPTHARVFPRLADGRSFDLEETFDAAFAFFHVVSYFTSDSDIKGLLSSVRKHLEPGSAFVFDTWYTPGVESLGLQSRKREITTDDYRMIRFSSSEQLPESSTVEVTHHFLVWNSDGLFEQEFEETHLMRHFTINEIRLLAESHGFRVSAVANSTGSGSPTREDWAATFALIAED